MHAADEAIPASSLSESQRQQVLAQLESLLVSPLFRQSKRYPAFLRYVVESTLQGDDEELKERTIGIEVFGRQPHYDTSMDPTVRLTAAEVRKRLAQYYQQPEHALQPHIDLHPGSYIPAFSWPLGTSQPTAASPAAEPQTLHAPVAESLEPELHSAAKRSPRSRIFPVAAALVLLSCVAFFIYRHASAVADQGLWTPLLNDPNRASFVLPDLSKTGFLPQAQETEATSVLAHIRDNRVVDFSDSVALANLSGMLGRWNKPYRVLLSSDTTFEDLQTGPSILIGAVDNPWTMRFLQSLPYSVARQGDTMTFSIIGKQNASPTGWSIDLTQPFGNLQQDFGIVARQVDTMTGRPVLIIAGLGQNGTAAGIRLLADPALEREITAAAPKGWSGRNLEVVFRTQIIDDKFGPPVIVAHEYW